MANNNSYFTTDKEIEELGKKIVTDLYSNKEITESSYNGRPLIGQLGALIERPISGICSNINQHKSLQHVLVNAIRYSVLIEKNASLEVEFKKMREASDRRKNMLLVLQRKLETDKNNETILEDIEKTKKDIELLDEQLGIIASKNSEPPTIRKNILELAKKAYGLLLRPDKTSEKLYIAVCKNLNVKIEKSHFGYDVYNNNYNGGYNNYNNGGGSGGYRPYTNRYENTEEKKDVYVPPQLKHRYGSNFGGRGGYNGRGGYSGRGGRGGYNGGHNPAPSGA